MLLGGSGLGLALQLDEDIFIFRRKIFFEKKTFSIQQSGFFPFREIAHDAHTLLQSR